MNSAVNKASPAPMSISCVIPANKVGGTERVVTTLAAAWASEGHRVCVIESRKKDEEAFYDLGEGVSSVQLGLDASSSWVGAALFNNVGRVLRLRKALRQSCPDVVVSFLTEQNVVTILSTLGFRTGVVVSERTDPVSARKPRVWRFLRWVTYRYADRVVVLNGRARKCFERYSTPVIIPNPVKVRENIGSCGRGKTIVAVGRLVETKRFDVLLRAFAQIARNYQSWRLVVVGEGPERTVLDRESERLGLGPRVRFTGSLQQPDVELDRASIFVSCSILEGFPMAVCEAMAAGLAVVVATYNDSVREIVQDGWNGVLIPPDDQRAAAQAIENLIKDEMLRVRLGENARESMKKLAPENVVAMWLRMFSEINNGGLRKAGNDRVAPPV